ncbi:DUF547 domain-containing protein [Natrarchaeobius halalkaliphilus]|uniref:DUF547 domain-containing protein n=1 Tax=Natrarchaeobius halalkaliphilus TaxID=1679091 RepID=A0A3N6P613_9EURY|nr:DUF547 domain-containing protein [Natrarchaeobius halalkaliphilus]RQG91145.1 DUF547 domain-containing protein [Natrarchaeobius halalkaliphilus]
MATQLDPHSLSADLLYSVKTEGDVDWLCEQLAVLERPQLERALSSRMDRLSFWLNCYNAYGQLLLEDEPSLLDGSLLDRWRFFRREQIRVSGVRVSLNDIEHGFLRSSKLRWGGGYLPRPLPSSFERQFRLEECDPRVHFGLGRESGSHPPTAVYSPNAVDDELDTVVTWSLEQNVEYDPDENVATVPQLFRTYRGDFGRKRGILDFLLTYDAIPSDRTPSLVYRAAQNTIEFPLETDVDDPIP